MYYIRQCRVAGKSYIIISVVKHIWKFCWCWYLRYCGVIALGIKCIGFAGKEGGAGHELYCHLLGLAILFGIELTQFILRILA